IEPEAFQALLRFLYLDEAQIGPETVMATLYAAKKYEINCKYGIVCVCACVCAYIYIYIYIDKHNQIHSNHVNILHEMLALEVACVDFLKANLYPDNAFMLLTQARLFDEANLADLCLETIDKHSMDALVSESFLEIDLDTLKL